MQSIVCIFLIFGSSVFAYASNFNGTWKGFGKYEPVPFAGFANPHEVGIKFEENGQVLTWKDRWPFGIYGDVVGWGLKFDIKGDQLSYNGIVVGSLFDNSIRIQYDSITISPGWVGPNNQFKYEIDLLPNGSLDFRYEAVSPQGDKVTKEALGLTR